MQEFTNPYFLALSFPARVCMAGGGGGRPARPADVFLVQGERCKTGEAISVSSQARTVK
jgi:hypothetical protein